jgi:phage terminase large subunit
MTLVVADSAEPKSIDEIKSYGVNIIGAVKGQGSVSHGIQHVQSFKISITRRSQNYIASYESFAWKINKQTGEAMKEYDHYLSDAMMSVIYGLSEYKGNERRQEIPREQKRVFNNGLYIG